MTTDYHSVSDDASVRKTLGVGGGGHSVSAAKDSKEPVENYDEVTYS